MYLYSKTLAWTCVISSYRLCLDETKPQFVKNRFYVVTDKNHQVFIFHEIGCFALCDAPMS